VRAATFLDVFDPPQGMVGQTAVLVAMTASESFLDSALERFTGLRARQRAALGSVQAWLMLDPHEAPGRAAVLAPGRPAGLHELQPRPVARSSLLHAKVALLSFGPSRRGEPAVLRLVVSTGNFTEASARHQLELVWTVEAELDGGSAEEDRRDVAAAATFLRRLLAARYYREGARSSGNADTWTRGLDDLLARAAGLADSDAAPRFLHSLDEPLLPQILARFERGGAARRNLLLAGSGFYEQASASGAKPKAVAELESIARLTSSARRVLLVEPSQAGAVARWARSKATDGWELAAPSVEDDRRRSLHAKFVYVGYLRDGAASNGSLYLGSGNLSRRGLMTHGGMQNGNVECGVVFHVSERLDADTLAKSLFWRVRATSITQEAWREDAGEGDALLGDLIEASPILSASIITEADVSWLVLHWREDVPSDLEVSIMWPGVEPRAVRPSTRRVRLAKGQSPSALEVTARATGRRWVVPVVDANGRVAWSPSTFERWEDVVEALLEFPLRSAGSADDDDDGGEGRDEPVGGGGAEEAPPHQYALHAAAALIEQVAAHQATLPPNLLDEWLDHLDRVFAGRFPEPMLAAWRSARINVLEPLGAPALAPPGMSEVQRRRYEGILSGTTTRWGQA